MGCVQPAAMPKNDKTQFDETNTEYELDRNNNLKITDNENNKQIINVNDESKSQHVNKTNDNHINDIDEEEEDKNIYRIPMEADFMSEYSEQSEIDTISTNYDQDSENGFNFDQYRWNLHGLDAESDADDDDDGYSTDSSDSFLPQTLRLRPTLNIGQYAVRDDGWQHIESTTIPKLAKPISDIINIDFMFLKRYKSHSYINNYKGVINGYIREIEDLCGNVIPYGINIICDKFYFDEIKHITQITYNLCTFICNFCHENVVKYELNTSKDLDLIQQETQRTETEIEGFTGNELFLQIQKHLNLTEQEANDYCTGLVKYGFVNLIAIRRILAINDYGFHCNDKYLYVSDISRQEILTKYKQFELMHDRNAWNINTNVQIYDNNDNIWKSAVIHNIDDNKNDHLIVKTENNQYKSNRYNHKQIRSTKSFILRRENWCKNDKINMYNKENRIWIQGKIQDISIKNNIESYIDILTIIYSYNNKSYIQYVSRWSPFIQFI